MRHIWYLIAAALASGAVSVMLSVFGAHGTVGFVAVYVGYCGGFVNWKVNPGGFSYLLITAVNGAVYFAILELAGSVLRVKHSPGAVLRP